MPKTSRPQGCNQPLAGMLTPAQMEEGWICLFDGGDDLRLEDRSDGKVADGKLALCGDKATTAETTTGSAATTADRGRGLGRRPGRVERKSKLPKAGNGGAGGLAIKVKAAGKPLPVRIQVPAGKTVRISKIILKPTGMESIFNGKDLTGWKPVEGKKSVFSVVDGAINIKDGNGEIQSDWQGDDFVLQTAGISHAKNLNRTAVFPGAAGSSGRATSPDPNEWSATQGRKRNASGKTLQALGHRTGGLYNACPPAVSVQRQGVFTMPCSRSKQKICTG